MGIAAKPLIQPYIVVISISAVAPGVRRNGNTPSKIRAKMCIRDRDMGMFYKRRDYTKIVNGRNPIVAHEFLCSDVEGKDMIVIDDMISSGESVLEVAASLKKRKSRKIFICATSVSYTHLDVYKRQILNKIISVVHSAALNHFYEQAAPDNINSAGNGIGPVSYTHLDVYKRQDLGWDLYTSIPPGQFMGFIA